MVQGHAPFVFIVYARADREMVNRLVVDLHGAGIATWVDDQDLEPGTATWERAAAG